MAAVMRTMKNRKVFLVLSLNVLLGPNGCLVSAFSSASIQRWPSAPWWETSTTSLGTKPDQNRHVIDEDGDSKHRHAMTRPRTVLTGRRQLLQSMTVSALSAASLFLAFPEPAAAGEVGARITKAVTTSDLGIEVRRSVVRGAQVIDGVDSKWEQLSDRFGLGNARSKQPSKPAPKVIPQPQPLDSNVAQQILGICDATFVALTQVPAPELKQQIEKVATTVRPSFERSGLSLDDLQVTGTPRNGDQFNFCSYAHFKAYSDLIIDRKIDFARFRKEFERQVGRQLVPVFFGTTTSKPITEQLLATKNPQQKQEAIKLTIKQINQICATVVEKGLVALIDKVALDPEQVEDWMDDVEDLSWSIPLDGDVTLSAQVLLQEQGYRLYPNFARYAVQAILETLDGQQVALTDYYMDTDYNSDPEKFQVKEVLLNIELVSK